MDNNQSIAIVGIGGVFPGAADLRYFWENILAARDSAREPPAGRWLLSLEDVYTSAGPLADKVYSKRACFVDDFQPQLQGMDIDADLLATLDPMHSLLLHAGNQAWRDAKTSRLNRQRVGVIIGNIALPGDASSALADDMLLPVIEKQILGTVRHQSSVNTLNRYVAGLPAGVLAHALGLGGGSYTLDAACASSLYALKYALDELRAGRRDAMLCGGLSRPDSLYTQMGFSALHAISASGRCSPFDSKGDGLVVGEGAGMLLLKRLPDALADGDRIYATIAGIGLSNDIDGNLMSPDSEGQLRAMRAAYREAGWQPQDVDLIECHGTGTPVGDAVEFNSLQALWGAQANAGDCVIGSVKSNIGHLLTAAGSAGLIKVLLAMRHGQLPPTANYESASPGLDMDGSPFTVLREPREWQRRGPTSPRRAAISAFGFGGINAHVLLQEWQQEAVSATQGSRPVRLQSEPVAIVGMDACFGPWRDLQAFRERVLAGGEGRTPQRLQNSWGLEHKLQGHSLDEVVVALGRFRIPPNELKDMLPQQLLMLQVAANAIADAGVDTDAGTALQNAGVYIGIGLDLSTTNFHLRWKLLPMAREWARQLGLRLSEAEFAEWVEALRDSVWPAMNANRTMGALGGIVASRIARAFNVGGPSFTLSSEESSSLRALEAGVRALQRGEIDSAIVGAVDLASDIRALSARLFAREEGRPPVGEGAAAVLLKRHADALRDGDRIYALIKGMGAASGARTVGGRLDVSTFEQAIDESLQDAAASGDNIGLLESPGSYELQNNSAEFAVLQKRFSRRESKLACAVTRVANDIGDSGAAAGLASLLRASLSLYHRILPAEAARGSLRNADEGVFVPRSKQYWLRDRAAGPRQAMLGACSVDGNYLSAILEEAESESTTAQSTVAALPGLARMSLFSVCGEDKYALIDNLQGLRALLSEAAASSLADIARQWWQQQAHRQQQALAVSVLADSHAELAEKLKLAQAKVEAGQAVAESGLFYNPQPLAAAAKVAFVFPGSGSHFMDMGKEMSVHWPAVLEQLDRENRHLATQFAAGKFWTGTDSRDFTHEDFIFGQVWLGAMVSDVIASYGLQPDAVIGYCLGESVGLFATRSWRDRDLMLKRMQATDLFTQQLGGACEAARTTWQARADEHIDWQLGVLDRPADEVREYIAGRSRVYLMIINTPRECIIGGDRAAVQAVVKDLACGFHPLEGVTTVHCEVVKPVQAAYRDLHLFATTAPQKVAFYSGITGKQYAVNTDSAADSIVRQALETFDFTRLINTAYDDGVRIFIEMGPGASCCRMITRILGERQHIARAACVQGQSDVFNVLQILAQLNTERVALDLSSLYAEQTPRVQQAESAASIRVAIGRKAFSVPSPPKPQAAGAVEAKTAPGSTALPAAAALARPLPMPVSGDGAGDMTSVLIAEMSKTEVARAEVEEVFLRVANGIHTAMSQAISTQMHVLQHPGAAARDALDRAPTVSAPVALPEVARPAFDRAMCMEFAVGSIARVLGAQFAEVDSFPSRVRLPDEPLMLVDRILQVEGEPGSMDKGRVVTEHDVQAGAWYLDGGRIPTCIAVEAGQADLFLSAYLGADLHTRGEAVYRLLDAEVCFHGPLPQAGEVIHYDIHIDEFFRQGTTWLFRFHFDGSVNGTPLITMRKGCAGFFSAAELNAGRGIVQTTLEAQAMPGKCAADWQPPLPMQAEAYSDAQIDALRKGDLAGCFGGDFASLPLQQPVGLPGGRMTLVHRILGLEPEGGRFALGMITGEADIHADDWFLTCHFVDDQVMPGTLMYECCLHTLRVYLLRMGWVGEAGEFVYEPLAGISSRLKCRGQVRADTARVRYEISIKEIGYRGAEATPYVIADALMYADERAIVQMTDMSLQLSGLSRARIEAIWAAVGQPQAASAREVLYDYASINAFAVGKPSVAFGDKYRVFDEQRVIARLPGPPFQFLDRIVSIRDGEPWVLKAGAIIEGEYDVPVDAWYFAADRQANMPFAVLLEIALQPCGWLAAYLGSALTSDVDMSFRNLGGKATQLQAVTAASGTLTIKVKITNAALSGGMIIQNYDYEVRSAGGPVYVGDTYFGFFSKAALADQVGIRDVQPYEPDAAELARALRFAYPQQAPYADTQMRMVDEITCFVADGGPQGLGFIRAQAQVKPEAWFFKAHFYQDPVWPGSLGLESFLQLLKVVAVERWGGSGTAQFQCMALDQAHSWLYRGQILPTDELVTVQASITAVDDEQHCLQAEGFLSVDGRIIYQMSNFALRMTAL